VFIDIDVTKLSDSLYSYQHLKAFGNTNHLYLDPWNSDTVWFINSGLVIQRATLQVCITLLHYNCSHWLSRLHYFIHSKSS